MRKTMPVPPDSSCFEHGVVRFWSSPRNGGRSHGGHARSSRGSSEPRYACCLVSAGGEPLRVRGGLLNRGFALGIDGPSMEGPFLPNLHHAPGRPLTNHSFCPAQSRAGRGLQPSAGLVSSARTALEGSGLTLARYPAVLFLCSNAGSSLSQALPAPSPALHRRPPSLHPPGVQWQHNAHTPVCPSRRSLIRSGARRLRTGGCSLFAVDQRDGPRRARDGSYWEAAGARSTTCVRAP